MIIDLILERKDGAPYNPHTFYTNVMGYGEIWPELAHPIAEAMDSGTNEDVQRTLCGYIMSEGYNPAICGYIVNTDWIGYQL